MTFREEVASLRCRLFHRGWWREQEVKEKKVTRGITYRCRRCGREQLVVKMRSPLDRDDDEVINEEQAVRREKRTR